MRIIVGLATATIVAMMYVGKASAIHDANSIHACADTSIV